jgi:hypothetical protein
MNKLVPVLLFMIFWAIVGQIFVNDKSIAEIRINRANIESLQLVVEKQGDLIQWQSHRLTQLERPDEPVFPPRNPGRLGQIGSAD